LVAGAGTATGLAVARGLRGLGVPLIGAALDLTTPAARSRLWDDVLHVAEPTAPGWLAALDAAAARHGRMVLFPADDPAVRIVAHHAARLSDRFEFVMPEASVVDRLLDKSVFHEWALENNFPVPRTAVAGNLDELRAALREVGLPAVLKPLEHTPRWTAVSGRDKAFRLDTDGDLDRLPFSPFEAADRFVVQEWIPGRDSDVYFCLTYRNRDGEELAAQVGRKITQWPVDLGSTALTVTHHDTELHKLTRRVLDAAGHVGFGSLEVRVSNRDGRMVITEPTASRPDLQTALAEAAGVDLLNVAYRDALRLPVPEGRRTREAVWVHETAFPRSVVVAALGHRLDVRALLALFRTPRVVTGAYFSMRDPLPLTLEVSRIAARIFRSALGAARRVIGRG
jgi:predicted ATP-grasp superfamily ATP-dependent carboligase